MPQSDLVTSVNVSCISNDADNAKAYVLFAHGAGADKSSDFMAQMAQDLAAQQVSVLRFNFNYMDKRLHDGKRYPPDRMPKLIDCFNQVLANVNTNLPIFLMGKSMGGRVAATLAEQALTKVNGVICLGYPFHPQKQPEKLRLAPLQNTQLPVLIIQGERDALGNKSEITGYLMSPLCQIEYLPDGDHDLKPRKKSGVSHQDNLAQAVQLIVTFINEKI